MSDKEIQEEITEFRGVHLVKSEAEILSSIERWTGENFINRQIGDVPPSYYTRERLKGNLYFSNFDTYVYELFVEGPLSSLPESIGALQHLKNFTCFGAKFSKLPASFYKLINIEELDLRNNKLKKISENISNLTRLRTLNLAKNKLKTLPESLYKLNLVSLILQENRFKKLPNTISKFSVLNTLNLRYNKLKKLPDSIANVEIYHLYLDHNKLREIPSSMTNFRERRTLDLHNNKLRTIPENYDNLVFIKNLDFSNNELKTLPSSISKMKNLKEINLKNNPIKSLPLTFLKYKGKIHPTNLFLQEFKKPARNEPMEIYEFKLNFKDLFKLPALEPEFIKEISNLSNANLEEYSKFLFRRLSIELIKNDQGFLPLSKKFRTILKLIYDLLLIQDEINKIPLKNQTLTQFQKDLSKVILFFINYGHLKEGGVDLFSYNFIGIWHRFGILLYNILNGYYSDDPFSKIESLAQFFDVLLYYTASRAECAYENILDQVGWDLRDYKETGDIYESDYNEIRLELFKDSIKYDSYLKKEGNNYYFNFKHFGMWKGMWVDPPKKINFISIKQSQDPEKYIRKNYMQKALTCLLNSKILKLTDTELLGILKRIDNANLDFLQVKELICGIDPEFLLRFLIIVVKHYKTLKIKLDKVFIENLIKITPTPKEKYIERFLNLISI